MYNTKGAYQISGLVVKRNKKNTKTRNANRKNETMTIVVAYGPSEDGTVKK